MTLAQYLSKNRVILIFSPTAADPRLVRQLEVFKENASGVKERDIVVLPVEGATEMRIRSQFRIPVAEFVTVLIGKDGNEKHRWTGVAPMDQISHRIDRMPQRRVEMRTQ